MTSTYQMLGLLLLLLLVAANAWSVLEVLFFETISRRDLDHTALGLRLQSGATPCPALWQSVARFTSELPTRKVEAGLAYTIAVPWIH